MKISANWVSLMLRREGVWLTAEERQGAAAHYRDVPAYVRRGMRIPELGCFLRSVSQQSTEPHHSLQLDWANDTAFQALTIWPGEGSAAR
ncbi:hypothetical protein PTE30175_04879 [Pandoraea terrae]|uniref:Uncharacterized protein n=1 Tax=Pandoraea terrae TaxID=1537710 RepID=A0A5E4Z3L3_9BURK|nr:hypothetical protein PTE30175_04879 [Pandoraea terrae]